LYIIRTTLSLIPCNEVMSMKVKIVNSSNTDKKKEHCYDMINEFLQKVIKNESNLRSSVNNGSNERL
jgi:hypothetical protein